MTGTRVLRPILIGGVCGLVSLGLVGRAAMRLLAVFAGVPTGFSAGGTLEVLAAGFLIGAAAGPALVLTRRRGVGAGAAFGVLVFLVLLAFPPAAARSAAALVPGQLPLVIAVFLPVFVLYGVLLASVLQRAARSDVAEGTAPANPGRSEP
jgi:hypothetical protein